MPAEVRTGRAPDRIPVKPGDSIRADCSWDNSVGRQHQDLSVDWSFFTVHVYWGPQLRIDSPTGQVRIGTKTASYLRTSREGQPMCYVSFPISRGTVMVRTFNGRFPDVDTCALAKHLAFAVSNRVH
jgi:hypothetical protein